MYNGGWEVVGKNKKDKTAGKTGKLSKAEKKKFIENAPKVEDFLPLDQVKTLYDNLDGNKENKKPAKEKESKTKENEEKKKQQKQQLLEKKKEESPKGKLPKSIEEALNMIDVMEVQNLLASNQARFPDAPMVWLKTLVAFLNVKIPVEKDDPIFSGRPDGYPLNVVPKSLRIIFEKAVDSAGPLNARLFYEFTLTAMTMEMAKGTPVVGYKIFIQLLAKYDPKLSVSNIPKLISMRNSYQNKKNIGLSLLWSFNQGGRENLNSGLKIWHEVMAPMLEAKSYASYVFIMLNDLLRWHHDDQSVNFDIYLNIFDDLFSGKLNISQSVIDDGIPYLQKLRIILLKNKNINHRKIFETFLPKVNSKTPGNVETEVLNLLTGCLSIDSRCFVVWKSFYMKNLYISSSLLTHISANWSLLDPPLNSTNLSELLSAFQCSYEKSKKGKGKDDKYLHICYKTCEELFKKMSSKKYNKKGSKKGGFPWKTSIFFFVFLIGAIIAYDTQKHGSFEATSAGKFMRDKGITNFLEKSWVSTKFYSNKGLEYLEATSPEYYKTVADFFKPYVKLSGDLYLTVKNVAIKLYDNVSAYIAAKVPELQTAIEYYIPGFQDSVRKNFIKGMELMNIYSTWIVEQAVENFAKTTRWLKTNLFVGNLSPENLQIYASKAINTTQNFATKTYDWVYEKVQTLSKVE